MKMVIVRLCTGRFFTRLRKFLSHHEFKHRDGELINDMWTTRFEMLYGIPSRQSNSWSIILHHMYERYFEEIVTSTEGRSIY